MAQSSDKWFTYVLLCENNSFYRGYTNDLDKRFKQHQNGKGAKYTRMHKPIKIVYCEEFATKGEAMKRECYFKSAVGRKWLTEKLTTQWQRSRAKREVVNGGN